MNARIPFLTLEDPRAKVKGSRDPLGLVAIWYGFGRRLVCNLTTVSNSVRGFSAVLLGRYFAERLFEEEKIRDEDVLPVFLRTEQVVAYVRHVGYGVTDDIRGIERVKRHVAEAGRAGVRVGTRVGETILSDQKTYGLWGLFSASARASGLVREGPLGLTPEAREFVETVYLPHLLPVESRLLKLVRSGGNLRLDRRDAMFGAMANALREPVPATEAAFWEEWLRDARHVPHAAPGRQARLRALLQAHTDLSVPIGRTEFEAVARAAQADDPRLAQAARDVLDLEALLVPAELAFRFVLSRNRADVSSVARSLHDLWGRSIPHLRIERIRELLPRIKEGQGPEIASAVERTASALSVGDHDEVVVALLDWNRIVLDGRKSAPWVVRDARGRLDVRFEEGERVMPDGDALADSWHNSYFVDSLKRITLQLEGGA